jgi:HD-like signal output (HDOD) protein
MIGVLFVNDEPRILDRLRRDLHPYAEKWELRFAGGAQAALTELESKKAALVVSDLRMPGMDGVEFLRRVGERYPDIVRFILADDVVPADADRILPVAHQVLSKPDDTETLCRAIEGVTNLLAKAEEIPAVRRAIAAVQSLPPLPSLYWKLKAEIEKPSATAASVARIIEHDPGMSTRLLQMANSPAFGFGRHALTVREAATRLGLQQTHSAVLMLALTAAKARLRLPKGFSIAAMQLRSQRVACMAVSLVTVPEEKKTAFSAGMLHHVGYFAFAAGMPDEYERVMAAAASRRPVEQVEGELLGCDHAEVGAFMLALLGLPMELVEAVAHHHRPSASKDWFGPAAAVHIACLLAAQIEGQMVPDSAWDQDFLRGVPPFVQDLIDRWRGGEPVKASF